MGVQVKILFIDDEISVIQPLAMEAEDQGFSAMISDTPEEAFQLLEEHHETIGLVFSDYRMGKTTGLEFRKKMMEKYKHIPFIIYSGFVNEEMLREAIDLKVSRFIDKPFKVENVKNVILEDAKDRMEMIEEKETLRGIFLEEATDLLEDLELEIMALESNPNPDLINNIFRLVHTIKGGSGVLEWPDFTRTVHLYEDLLTKVKNGDMPISNEVVSVLLKGYDFVLNAINSLKDGEFIEIDVESWASLFALQGLSTKEEIQQDGTANTNQQASKKSEDEAIKVPTKILDEFMELSGEITVIRNTVNKLVSNLQKEFSGNSDLYLLAEYLDEMHKINSAMQSKITELRKVSLKSIFRTFPRTIRDLNQTLGKQIDLKVFGDEMRVDTKLAQVLRNSLIHVIRNSADHGIESAERRAESNKPKSGTINLRSIENGDEIIVEVEDDGGGINPDTIKNRAIEKNLYKPEVIEQMTAKQIFQIILEPGFSTAAHVTDISGRGVGMDMVKNSVESIGGKIDIDSQLGAGTKFSLKLPVPKSVMIIKSLLVRIGDRMFNIPQDNIIRLIKIEGDKRFEMIKRAQNCCLLDLNDALIQITDLTSTLSPQTEAIDMLDRKSIDIVLVKSEKLTFGIVVDEINDAEEIVVKKVPSQIMNQIYTGATFMGDGSVGLILDVDGIAEHKNMGEKAILEEKVRTTTADSDHSTIEGREYIIFSLPHPGLFAFNLEEVYRLEEFETKDFITVSGQLSIIYRDQVTPLFIVHQNLGFESNSSLLERDKQNIIIIESSNRYYGLIIDRIKEIKTINEELDNDISDRKEIEGSLIHEDSVITVINVKEVLGIPDVPSNTSENSNVIDMEKKLEQETVNESDLDLSSGFGMF